MVETSTKENDVLKTAVIKEWHDRLNLPFQRVSNHPLKAGKLPDAIMLKYN